MFNNDLIARVSRIDNENNAMFNQLKIVEDRLSRLEADMDMLKPAVLSLHEGVWQNDRNFEPPVDKQVKSIREFMEEMRTMAPYAYPYYEERLDANRVCYEGTPLHSCSVRGHKEAEAWKKFISRYLKGGYVLDIGCGPQPIPSYLEGYDVEKIYGIDPLEGEAHPFVFKQGISENIPWECDSFDVVMFATSLDHVFLLDKTWAEVYRVLRKGGFLLVWTSFDENAQKYNPYSSDFKPYDQYHMFHYNKHNLEEDLKDRFEQIEYFKSNTNTHFFAYRIIKE